MAEAKSASKSARPAPQEGPARRSPANDTPNTPEPATTSDLTQIIQELQKRLASVEKRQTASTRKRKSDASSDAAQTPARSDGKTPAKASASAALEARLQDFRDLEQALHLEELALHTRGKAAAQEELLLQHESQTLQLKMKSFRAATQRLREQESQLQQGLATLTLERQKLEEERRTLEQVRLELEAARQQLDADRAAMKEQSIALTAPLAALVSGPQESDVHRTDLTSKFRLIRIISLTSLALASVVGLSITLAWLTIDPIYRASATVQGLVIDPAAATSDHAAWLTDATLEKSMTTLEQRGLRPFASVEIMRQAMQEHLTLSPSEEGSTEFAYESHHRDQAVLILDAMMRSLVQTDGAAPPAPASLTLTRAAAADLDPVRDGRLRATLAYVLLMACIITGIEVLRRKIQQT